jgi:hypothetical protein
MPRAFDRAREKPAFSSRNAASFPAGERPMNEAFGVA